MVSVLIALSLRFPDVPRNMGLQACAGWATFLSHLHLPLFPWGMGEELIVTLPGGRSAQLHCFTTPCLKRNLLLPGIPHSLLLSVPSYFVWHLKRVSPRALD